MDGNHMKTMTVAPEYMSKVSLLFVNYAVRLEVSDLF